MPSIFQFSEHFPSEINVSWEDIKKVNRPECLFSESPTVTYPWNLLSNRGSECHMTCDRTVRRQVRNPASETSFESDKQPTRTIMETSKLMSVYLIYLLFVSMSDLKIDRLRGWLKLKIKLRLNGNYECQLKVKLKVS